MSGTVPGARDATETGPTVWPPPLPDSPGSSGEASSDQCFFLWLDPHRDLSENAIQAIPRKAFRGATDLKNL